MKLMMAQITIQAESFSTEVPTPRYVTGIMLPHDPHPQQKALFCQQVEANEVVCSIERFDLLAVTTSLKESTKGKIGHWTLSFDIVSVIVLFNIDYYLAHPCAALLSVRPCLSTFYLFSCSFCLFWPCYGGTTVYDKPYLCKRRHSVSCTICMISINAGILKYTRLSMLASET